MSVEDKHMSNVEEHEACHDCCCGETVECEETEQCQEECCSECSEPEQDTSDQRCKELEAQLLYLRADFDNFRRNMSKERLTWMRTAQADLLKGLLEIVDDFDRALTDLHGNKELTEHERSRLQGIELIHKSFEKFLSSHDVKEIATGGVFNPELHEAVMQAESEDHESGNIVQVFQKGYTVQDVVIRPAKVSVAK